MNDTGSFVAAVLRELAASTAVILAAWGALGGATNALTTKMRLRDALRHILLGGLIAAGMGSLSMAVITAWLACRPRRSPRAVQRARPPISSASSDRPSSKCCWPACVVPSGATAMNEILRLARSLRCDPADPRAALPTVCASASPSQH